ncbi:von Willebrand factor type A domain-containing protein [Marinovum sp. 2_MG-2023]|uniref:vWA domain-containing protein n=1 Tax=unclassified Marinovum TaxID=2647166 RepID=UPI0026E2FE7C|nr:MULTISPECIES: von Willebrand factor type A domain-containing protein [unclassified Marinovum]MDO6730161.1 von Willebrand factor type A domain-containing protein [Marinovum sp. 2_MG-2023]MDO6778899.1 von Willebrand factor type A domain-containing protein [Marinovum sp. 1_MG-2023]
MSDELDKLAKALRAATPTPDAEHKAANIAAAKKIFADAQGYDDSARHTLERPKRSVFQRGLTAMLNTLSPRAALGATTAIALIGVVMILPTLDRDVLTVGPRSVQEVPKTVSDMDAPVEEALIASDVDTAVTRPQVFFSGAGDGAASAPPAPMAEPTIDMADAPIGGLLSMEAPTPRSYSTGLARTKQGVNDMYVRPAPDPVASVPEGDTDAFPEAETNPLKVTAQSPVSTFSIDVDTAGWSVLRNMLENGQLPQKDTVRIEEMVNYFPYDYAGPDAGPDSGAAFRAGVMVAETPWNAGTRLVHIGIQGALPEVDERPALNLVFLVDVSGSMNHPNKLPLLKQSLRLMLGELRPEDEVAIVTYAGSAGVALEPTKAAERETILAALEGLGAGGGTAGAQGIETAYAMAEKMQGEGEINRVLLATDGDFNIGIHDPDALKDFIEVKRDSGTYLSVLGFGRGNLDDTTMQTLAQNGNGQAAYIDTLSEAQKVLVDQLTGALFPIADDVKIQVEFNPAQIAEYRLIGYETRALRREDFNNDKVDAGDIGAGHQVTAIYEVTPVGSDARLTDPLRYGAEPAANDSDELGLLRLRYKAPGEDSSRLIETPIVAGGQPTADMRFAFAIAGFGQLLRGGAYLGDWSFGDAIALANGAKGSDDFGYRAEAVRLMRLAQTLAE